MQLKYSAAVLIASLLLFIILTVQVFVTGQTAVNKIDRGGTRDSGTFPKRSRNLNAYSIPKFTDTDPDATVLKSYPVYPNISSPDYGNPLRIKLVMTTKCPIFRAQDNGSVDPPLLG